MIVKKFPKIGNIFFPKPNFFLGFIKPQFLLGFNLPYYLLFLAYLNKSEQFL